MLLVSCLLRHTVKVLVIADGEEVLKPVFSTRHEALGH